MKNKLLTLGIVIISFWVLVAIFAPWIAPYDANASITPNMTPFTNDSEGNFFLLGTDHLGRDILSRIFYGAQRVLLLAPIATLCAYLIGVPMGLAAGYFKGVWDSILSFLSNVILSFPALVLYILIIATVGPSVMNVIIAIVFGTTPSVMRLSRSLALDIRNRDYVATAILRGESSFWILFFEILPNASGPLIVDSCLRLGYVIITIGVLGFLGLGLPPPYPDWGGMVNETRYLASNFPHMIVSPCIAISSLVLGLNFLADGLKEKYGQ